jgi:hypothetical protein
VLKKIKQEKEKKMKAKEYSEELSGDNYINKEKILGLINSLEWEIEDTITNLNRNLDYKWYIEHGHSKINVNEDNVDEYNHIDRVIAFITDFTPNMHDEVEKKQDLIYGFNSKLENIKKELGTVSIDRLEFFYDVTDEALLYIEYLEDTEEALNELCGELEDTFTELEELIGTDEAIEYKTSQEAHKELIEAFVYMNNSIYGLEVALEEVKEYVNEIGLEIEEL